MTQRRFTGRSIEALTTKAAAYDAFDPATPGLAVRVSPGAKKTFVLAARFGGKNPTRRALGVYPSMSLEDAREKAAAWRKLMARGLDPAEEEDRARRAALRRRATTFEAVVDDYVKAVLPRQRKGKIVARELRDEFVLAFGNRAITDIEPADVKAVIRAAVDRGAPYQGHNLLGHVRRLFNWAISEESYGLATSPCDRIKPKDLIGPKEPRQRVLTDIEIFALWRASGRMGYPFGTLFRLLLLTGQRKSEVAGARWREFDPGLVRMIKDHQDDDPPIAWAKIAAASKVWTVPEERFKSKARHMVPLSDAACEIVAGLPHFLKGDHLFSGTFGAKPVGGFGKAKERLDRRMMRTLRALARRRGDDPDRVEMPGFVIHDLRRTLRTRLSALRVPDHIAEMVIGHGRRGLQRVYDQHTYLAEMREALDAWAAALRTILEPAPSNVVSLAQATAR